MRNQHTSWLNTWWRARMITLMANSITLFISKKTSVEPSLSRYHARRLWISLSYVRIASTYRVSTNFTQIDTVSLPCISHYCRRLDLVTASRLQLHYRTLQVRLSQRAPSLGRVLFSVRTPSLTSKCTTVAGGFDLNWRGSLKSLHGLLCPAL